MILFQFDNTGYAPLFVRIVTPGEKFGRDNVLINFNIESLIEFYDARFPDAALNESVPGQFITRYHMSTLMDRSVNPLMLQSDVQAWSANLTTMRALNVILSAMFVYVPGVSFP